MDRLKALLSVVTWVGPVVLGLVAGYGSVTFTSGAREQRLATAELKVIELQKQVEATRERYITREELRIYMDAQSETLRQIREDVRAMRDRR